MVAPARTATLADLDATPDDGQIYELLNGEVVVSPAPTPRHQDTLTAFFRVLDRWVTERDLGDVMVAPTDVVLDEGNALQPDLFFYPVEDPLEEVNGRLQGAPAIAVEIISPSSRSRDAVVKAMRYAKAGVKEYCLIDPELHAITVFSLSYDMFVERLPEPDGNLTSGVLEGLRVDPIAIFTQVDRAGARRRRPR